MSKNLNTAGSASSPFNDHPISSGRQIKGETCNIVMCLDGTENQFGPLPFTNVLKIYRLLEKESDRQICYYQPGVGVSFHAESNNIKQGNFLASKASTVASKVDAMIAFSLGNHVKAAYKFLMRYYRPGDRIYLFGFSRGAFMARILAGMIERVGLLNYGLEEMVITAWELYSNWEFAGQPAQPDFNSSLVDEFKETFSRENVQIHFMGLWDSVNSVGILRDRMFPYSARSNIVKHTRHALSLDERRGKYKQVSFSTNSYVPSFFSLSCEDCERPSSTDDISIADTSDDSISSSANLNNQRVENSRNFASMLRFPFFGFRGDKKKSTVRSTSSSSDMSPDLIEMWFPGNHGDIGGGWPPDRTGHFLSDIPLRWMIAEAAEFGILFKQGSIHKFAEEHSSVESLLSCHHDLLSMKRTHKMNHYVPKSTIAEKLHKFLFWRKQNYTDCDDMERDLRSLLRRRLIDRERSLSQISENSYLSIGSLEKSKYQRFDSRGDESFFKTIAWWMVELFPIGLKIEDETGQWRSFYVPNLGRNRHLPKDVSLHWSVYYRMYYVADYKPKNLPRSILKEWRQTVNCPSETSEDLTDVANCDVNSDVEDRTTRLNYDWKTIPDDLERVLKAFANI